MDIDLVLNELSFHLPAESISLARSRMSTLLRTIIAATKAGAARTLRTHRDLNDEVLASDYPIRRWRNDGEVDREEQRFFRSLTSKAPFLVDLPDQASEALGIECSCSGESASGLGVAWLLDLYPLSLLSAPTWDCSQIELTIAEFDSNGEIAEDTVSIVHASRPEHIGLHQSWFEQRISSARSQLQQGITSGSELWVKRGVLFPHLRFCDEVERQLGNIERGSQMLGPVMRRLFELEQYCVTWGPNTFDPAALPSRVSPESQTTLEQFGSERMFRYQGQARLFRWHARLTPGAWRLYFDPDPTDQVFYIGYVGKHLPTTRFRT